MRNIDRITMVWSGAVVSWASLSDDGSPANFVHRTCSREVWRESTLAQRALLILAFVLRPLTALAAAAVCTSYNGREIERRTGKSIPRQLWEQIGVALAHSIPPPWYYTLELYDDDKRRRAPQYLNRFETKAFLYRFLRAHAGPEPTCPRGTAEFLSDKAAFAIRCRDHDVAAVPALLVAENGKVGPAEGGELGRDALPRIDLFVKPLRGAGGRGAERWEFAPPLGYRDANGILLTEGQLLERLEGLSQATSYVVRPRVVNHPAIADLSNGALTTVRVMTCLDEDGGIEACAAVFRMAQGRNTVVDNFHAGGIVAPVDLRTGVLGRAVDGGMFGKGTGWHEVHPDTRAQILGRKLPMWDEVIALVRRAHAEAFGDQVVVGWDVALTSRGPQLVEGNKGPCLDLLQRPSAGPLGDTRLGELLAFHLRRALERKYAGRDTQSSAGAA